MPTALIDTNVLLAALIPDHPHHRPSLAALDAPGLATATHCLSETYSNLTRRDKLGRSRLSAAAALDVVDSLAAGLRVLTLTQPQHLDALRAFARAGGVGPRVYDHLIGYTASAHGIGMLITWNVGDFSGPFPGMRVMTPEEWGVRGPSHPR